MNVLLASTFYRSWLGSKRIESWIIYSLCASRRRHLEVALTLFDGPLCTSI